MKTKNFKFKSMALVLFALVLSSNVWGESPISLTLSDFGWTTTSYSSKSATKDDVTFTINNGAKNGTSNIAFKASATLTHTTAIPGKITNVTLNGVSYSSSSNAGFYVYVGTSSDAVTTMKYDGAGTGTVSVDIDGNYTFLRIANKASRALYTSSIVITYEEESDPVTSLDLYIAGDHTDDKSGHNVGGSYTLPTEVTAECGDKVLVGWSTVEIQTPSAMKPISNYYDKGASVTLVANNTFYAVFADAVGGGGASGSVVVSHSSENFPTGYGTANTFAEYTLEGYKFMIQQVYKNGEKQQWRANGNTNGTGIIYNSDKFPSKISSVVVTWDNSDTNKNHTLNKGNSANPSSGTSVTGVPSADGKTTTFDCGGDCDYFVLTNGANAGYTSSFTINYGASTTYSNYTTTCASCTNKVTVTKGAATGGTYTLKAGSASGAEIADGGTVDNCDANATIVVVPNADSHYHCTGVTAFNSASVTGPDGSGNYTITYTQGSSISSTINVEFAEDTKYTISFQDNIQLEDVPSQEVYDGETFIFPDLDDRTAAIKGTCEQMHYHFMGWVISTHTGEITVGDIETGTSAPVYAPATYKAVWAKEDEE